MPDVTLITCTGDRPESFALAEEYMLRQTFTDWHWVVIDDGANPTECRLGQQYVKLPPAASPTESFRRNLSVAMELVQGRKILFIEDDDVYLPYYIELQSNLLDRWDLTGEGRCKYYHLRHRRWKVHTNVHHASLCQTGMRVGSVSMTFSMMLRTTKTPQQADGHIWRRQDVPEDRKFILPCSTQVIATKGLPGRQGLGIHHRPEELDKAQYNHDPDYAMLRRWTGEYAKLLETFYPDLPVTAAGAECAAV